MKNRLFVVKLTIAALVGTVMCLLSVTAAAENDDLRKELSEHELKEVQSILSDAMPTIEGLISVGVQRKENKILLGVSDTQKYADSIRSEILSIMTENGFLSECDSNRLSFDAMFIISQVGVPSARPAKKNGWVKSQGNKMYYKDGDKVTQSTTIDGIRYKFSANGICEGKYTGWTKSPKGYKYWSNGKWDGIIYKEMQKG